MSPIEKLDTILRLLVENEVLRPWASETDILSAMYPRQDINAINPFDIGKALEHLHEQGFIKINVNGEYRYKTTFNGELFHQNGGYQGQLDRQNAESNRVVAVEKRQRVNERLMIYLTATLAFSSIAGLLVEMLKHWHWILSIELWTFFFVLLSGIIAGLIISLIIQHLRKRR